MAVTVTLEVPVGVPVTTLKFESPEAPPPGAELVTTTGYCPRVARSFELSWIDIWAGLMKVLTGCNLHPSFLPTYLPPTNYSHPLALVNVCFFRSQWVSWRLRRRGEEEKRKKSDHRHYSSLVPPSQEIHEEWLMRVEDQRSVAIVTRKQSTTPLSIKN